jgi:predicted TIM-barrel fold metal-dependent hydrolase
MQPTMPNPIADTRIPRVRFPVGATDCHAHVFESRFRLLPDAHVIPPECTLDDYTRMLRTIGCDRAVLVQPSIYGTDNAAIEEALASGSFNLRGIAVVAPDVSDKELERLHGLGFRGIRVNIASGTPGLKLADAPRLAERVKPLGWHLQFFANFRENPSLADEIAKLDITVVIDHFARIPASEGVTGRAFQALLALMRSDNCYAKLMGPYFVSDHPPAYVDMAPLVRELVAAAPDRLVWATDWPHTQGKKYMPNDGDLADMLAEWVPDEGQRRKILVDNPARLYGFE